MAKALPIAELSKDDPFAVAAAAVVAVRTRELFEAADGVLDTSDIERVHDMRVATRRLRAALEVFEPCFPKRRFRAVLKEVKVLADALGERRDRDVHIADLSEFESHVRPADRPGVRSFVAHLRDEQAEANRALAPYVADQRLAGLRERLEELVPATSSASPPGVPGPGIARAVDMPVADPPAAPERPPAPAATNGGEPR